MNPFALCFDQLKQQMFSAPVQVVGHLLIMKRLQKINLESTDKQG